MMQHGPIGTHHGKMHELVRNPFRTKFMRDNYDAAIKTYDEKHQNFITANGTRCTGNAWANEFWRGFDNLVDPTRWDAASKQSAGYATYRAGRDVGQAVAILAVRD
jgi:hypothetical protein